MPHVEQRGYTLVYIHSVCTTRVNSSEEELLPQEHLAFSLDIGPALEELCAYPHPNMEPFAVSPLYKWCHPHPRSIMKHRKGILFPENTLQIGTVPM